MNIVTTRIYVTSAEGGTGKSTVVIGLLDALERTVGRVGVFRPIARGPATATTCSNCCSSTRRPG